MRTVVGAGKTGLLGALMVAGLVSAAPEVFAQAGIYAYPKGNQSQEQQGRDRAECHQWAVGQSGFDPAAPAPNAGGYSSPPPSSSGGPLGFGSGGMFQGSGMLGDAATGAGLGAAGGAIAGNAGKGAAIGALAGTLFGGIQRHSRRSQEEAWRRQQQQHQQAQARQRDQRAQGYRSAFGACMSARNYQVQ